MGSNHAKYGLRRGPHVSRIVFSEPDSCDAKWLAREAARDDIHESSVSVSVVSGEGSDVAEDGRGIQVPATNV